MWESFNTFGHALRDQIVLPILLRLEPELRSSFIASCMDSTASLPWPSRASLTPSSSVAMGVPVLLQDNQGS